MFWVELPALTHRWSQSKLGSTLVRQCLTFSHNSEFHAQTVRHIFSVLNTEKQMKLYVNLTDNGHLLVSVYIYFQYVLASISVITENMKPIILDTISPVTRGLSGHVWHSLTLTTWLSRFTLKWSDFSKCSPHYTDIFKQHSLTPWKRIQSINYNGFIEAGECKQVSA